MLSIDLANPRSPMTRVSPLRNMFLLIFEIVLTFIDLKYLNVFTLALCLDVFYYFHAKILVLLKFAGYKIKSSNRQFFGFD